MAGLLGARWLGAGMESAWVVANGLVACWQVAVVSNTDTYTHYTDHKHRKITHLFCTRTTGYKVFGKKDSYSQNFQNLLLEKYNRGTTFKFLLL